MTHTIRFEIEPRRNGWIAIIYVDGLLVEKRRFYDRDTAEAWCVSELEERQAHKGKAR